jgi:ATP-dependent helicase Lhr and Lhr-like helicase
MKDLYGLFLERHGSFTEIQKLSVPAIGNGSNCLIVAPTGAGKTEAAVLSLLNSMIGKDESLIRILYITPLRAVLKEMQLFKPYRILRTKGHNSAVHL